MTLKHNVGTLDQWLRIGGGIVLLALAVGGAIGPWGYLGVVPLATGLVRFCPLYSVLGLRTCPARPPEAS